jgi:hypothetical protein
MADFAALERLFLADCLKIPAEERHAVLDAVLRRRPDAGTVAVAFLLLKAERIEGEMAADVAELIAAHEA